MNPSLHKGHFLMLRWQSGTLSLMKSGHPTSSHPSNNLLKITFWLFLLLFVCFYTYLVSCNGPCALKEKWHRKEHIIIIIIMYKPWQLYGCACCLADAGCHRYQSCLGSLCRKGGLTWSQPQRGGSCAEPSADSPQMCDLLPSPAQNKALKNWRKEKPDSKEPGQLSERMME